MRTVTDDRVRDLCLTPKGQRRVNAMVARALGATTTEAWRDTLAWRWPDGTDGHSAPPPYVSGTDWRLWGEMIDFLRTRFPDCDVVLQMYGDHGYSDDGSNHVCIYRPPPGDDKAERRPAVAGCVARGNDCGPVVAGREGAPAKSLSLALAAAMAAAGLLEEIPDGK